MCMCAGFMADSCIVISQRVLMPRPPSKIMFAFVLNCLHESYIFFILCHICAAQKSSCAVQRTKRGV